MKKFPSIVNENSDFVSEKTKPTFEQAFLLATVKNAEFKFGNVWW